jgi:hypothetical protein
MSFDFVENFTIQMPDFSKMDLDFSESFNSKHGLIIEVAAIHEGLTSNYNNYSSEELEKALQSWVEPYPKPIILNHDMNTEPMGRVIAARMDKESDGATYVRLQIAITDPIAAQKVLDKRYLTGSVGGRAGKAVCSITGDDLAREDASGRPQVSKFKRGQVYKGKLAYIDMQDISFKEYSFVNQPADQKSGVRSTKIGSGSAEVNNSDNWVARSSAFVLSMDNEDIFSISENKSILKEMKKKESKPIYLHLKGAFLTALALHESENDNNNTKSLLCNEDSKIIDSEETHSMDDVTKDEDILAVAAGLSEDLSNIAAATNREDSEEAASQEAVDASNEEEVQEEIVSEEEISSEEKAKEDSSDDSEEAEVQVVDSENAEKPEEASSEKDDAVQEEVNQSNDLSAENAGIEHVTEELQNKVKLLEEENARLKGALHMTLVERVVDTKIALGHEQVEDREKLIADHATRTASSLADTLRDLAKTPVKLAKRISNFIGMPQVTSEAEVTEAEENVLTVGKEDIVDQTTPITDSFEQVLVDALMGRRKL